MKMRKFYLAFCVSISSCLILLLTKLAFYYHHCNAHKPVEIATYVQNIHHIPSQALPTTTEIQIDNIIMCVISVKRLKVSYTQAVLDAMVQNVSVRGVLIDLDDVHEGIRLPARFLRLVPSDRLRETCDANEGDIGRPNCVTRQQARDVALALRRCTELSASDTWVLLVEDDMLLCESGLWRLQEWVATLQADKVRIAKFGRLPGVAGFPPPRSALPYAEAILAQQNNTPCDLMLDSTWRQGNVMRYGGGSLFTHIGSVSTNPYRNTDAYVKEWGAMRSEQCGAM